MHLSLWGFLIYDLWKSSQGFFFANDMIIKLVGCSDGLSISWVSQTDDAIWESVGHGMGTDSELPSHISLEASNLQSPAPNLFAFHFI